MAISQEKKSPKLLNQNQIKHANLSAMGIVTNQESGVGSRFGIDIIIVW